MTSGGQHMDVEGLLQHVAAELQAGAVAAGMDRLFLGLRELRHILPSDEWRAVITARLRPHPLMQLVQHDPLTRRAYEKPRGYAGDAVLMDYIYAADAEDEPAFLANQSTLGKAVYDYTVHAAAAQAVRTRRQVLTNAIDARAASVPAPSILSVACGHLQEARASQGLQAGRIARYVALDQDRMSLDTVTYRLAGYPIETIHASARSLFQRQPTLRGFDLIYVAGLYDYLDDRLIEKLTMSLFQRLNPGGSLLVANFLPGIVDAGYMEAYMDWWLIYRSAAQMMDLVQAIPAAAIAEYHTFIEERQNIVFLQITRQH